MILLTFSEAAARVGVSEMTIRRRVRDGSLPEVRAGPRPRVRLTDLQRLYPELSPVLKAPVQPCRIIAFANQKGGLAR